LHHLFFAVFIFQMKKISGAILCTPCGMLCHGFHGAKKVHGNLPCPVHPLRSLHCVCQASQNLFYFLMDCFSLAILIPFSSAAAQSSGCRVLARLRVGTGFGLDFFCSLPAARLSPRVYNIGRTRPVRTGLPCFHLCLHSQRLATQRPQITPLRYVYCSRSPCAGSRLFYRICVPPEFILRPGIFKKHSP
jgi:hypothetical protein